MATVQATVAIQEPEGHAEGDGAESEVVRDGSTFETFTVTKVGPSEGELTTEVRELIDDSTMRATFSHTKGGQTTTVVRIYTRARAA